MKNILLFVIFIGVIFTVSCSTSLEEDFWLAVANKSVTITTTIDDDRDIGTSTDDGTTDDSTSSDTTESTAQEYLLGTFSDDGKEFETDVFTDLTLRCTDVESINKATYVVYSGGTSYTFIFDIDGSNVEVTMITHSISGSFEDIEEIAIGTIY